MNFAAPALVLLLLGAAPTADPALLAEARRVAQDVQRLRGLAFPEPPVAARADRALQEAAGRARLGRALSAARLAARGRAWADLGLSGEEGPARLYRRLLADLDGFALSADTRQLLVAADRLTEADFGGEQGADEKALTLLLATARRPDEPALAHMLVHLLHALRGEDAGLPETSDAALVARALREGEANLVAMRYLFEAMGLEEVVLERGLDPSEVLEGRLVPPLAGASSLERRVLEGVYRHGYARARELYRRGGWGAVESAARAWRTTRALLHPEKPAQPPAAIELPPPPAEGLQLADADRLGELLLRALVAGASGSEAEAALAAEGWEGDLLLRWEPPAGGEGWTCWWTLWSSEIEAREFAETATRIAGTRPAAARRQSWVEREGRTVRWWIGPPGSKSERDAGAHLR